MPVSRVFLGDDRLVGVTLAEFEVLVFDHPGIRGFGIRVVDNRVPLVVVNIQLLGFKAQAPVLKLTELVAKVLVDHPGKDNLREFGFVLRLLGKKINPGFDVN